MRIAKSPGRVRLLRKISGLLNQWDWGLVLRKKALLPGVIAVARSPSGPTFVLWELSSVNIVSARKRFLEPGDYSMCLNYLAGWGRSNVLD